VMASGYSFQYITILFKQINKPLWRKSHLSKIDAVFVRVNKKYVNQSRKYEMF
jgi:hypothetical protein